MELLHMRADQCLLYSAAMLLNEDPVVLSTEIGHNGQEIWWPNLKTPYSKRGHHIQEILDCFLRRGKVLCPVQMLPTAQPYDTDQPIKPIFTDAEGTKRFINHIVKRPGILITPNHACAWDGKSVYDPNGKIGEISEYRIIEMWIIGKAIMNS